MRRTARLFATIGGMLLGMALADPAKRKDLVWQIERKLIEAAVRPIVFFMRQGTCWQPEVKGLTPMENSIFNSWRMEDVWLDR
jgi:peptide/nickel transport system substrate-binding protein